MGEVLEINGSRVEFVRDVAEGSARAAELFLDRRDQPRAGPFNCLVSTGATFRPFYKLIASEPVESFKNVNACLWDEYCEQAGGHYRLIDREDSQSFVREMHEQLFAKQPRITGRWPGMTPGEWHEGRYQTGRYDELTRAIGGLHLAMNGIGRNGHIGFNEPGSPLDSRTRVVKLAAETRLANATSEGQLAPQYAVTGGLATIMEADEIITLAFGAHKAVAVYRAIRGSVSPACPASILQLHPAHRWVLDEAAAQWL